jgi:hypothetical protein
MAERLYGASFTSSVFQVFITTAIMNLLEI